MPTQSERERNFGDPTGGATAYLALIGVLIFILVIIYLEALFYSAEEKQRVDKIVDQPNLQLKSIQDDQEALLVEHRYDHDFNEGGGRVTIPITAGRQKLLEEWPNINLGFTPPEPVEEGSE